MLEPLAPLEGMAELAELSGMAGLVASGVVVVLGIVPVLGDVLVLGVVLGDMLEPPVLEPPIDGLLAPEGVSVLRLQADNAVSTHVTAIALRSER